MILAYMSWADWVMSWFEPRHSSRMPKKGYTNSTLEWNAQKRSTKLTEGPKNVNEINSWFESLSQDLTRINIPDSPLSHESIWIKFWKVFRVVSWFESKYSGSFLSRESIWIGCQKHIFSRELIWINYCKAIVSHELIRIKTFWAWVESNRKESYHYLVDISQSRMGCARMIYVFTLQKKTRYLPDVVDYTAGIWSFSFFLGLLMFSNIWKIASNSYLS